MAVDPLFQYLEIYKKYETECKLSVRDYIAKQDKDEDESIDIIEIKKDIYKHFDEANWLKSEIPEKIVVSMFEIDCWDMWEALSGKHWKIAEEEIEIIAKTARNQTNKLLNKFKEWHNIIEKSP